MSFPDVLLDLRTWLRADPTLAAYHDGRVFFRIPDNPNQAPFMRIYRSGGAVQAGETPIQDIRVAVEVWGLQNSDYQNVRLLVNALEVLCHSIQVPTPIGAETLLRNAQVTTAFDSPDPDLGWPRFVCDLVATVSSTS